MNSEPPQGAAKLSAPAERNREPILETLRQVLPATGLALEIASGTGQHVAYFATQLPGWTWQPTDAQPDAFGSIAAWCDQAGVANVREAQVLDVLNLLWPSPLTPFAQAFDAIYCANMLHIAPWSTCAGLMQGAAKYLTPKGLLITYGPYLEHDVPTSPGNLAFDQSLRERNSDWGIRGLDDVTAQASKAGLTLHKRFQMPANNLLLVFGRQA